MSKLVSIVIPAYNEANVIENCLKTLSHQTYNNLEIIVVDDGSTDETLDLTKEFKVKILKQKHQGPGSARNLGASVASGEILVFVDADMTFEENFIRDIVKPILDGKTIGTFSKNEIVANKENIWSICWNINRNVPSYRMLPKDYPNRAPVFRAILKKEFDKVGGFETTGEYTDDWSLSKKLGVKSTLARGAIYYHFNPSTLYEVWKQARWIGKNEFISGTILRRAKSIFLYSLPVSFLVGIFKSAINLNPRFLIFKLVYDLAVFTSSVKSFTSEPKFK